MDHDELILKDVFGITDEPQEEQEDEVVEETTEETTDETEGENEETDQEDTEQTVENSETEEEVSDETEEETTEEVETEEAKPEISEDITALLKEIDPEAEVTDQKGALEVIKERYSELKETTEAYEKSNKEIFEVLNDNPDVADYLKALIRGVNPVTAHKVYLSEELPPEAAEREDPDYKEELSKKNAAKIQSAKALEEFKANHEKSRKLAEEFVTESKLNPAEFEKELNKFDSQIAELKKGIITKDLLSTVLKASKYEKDLKEAEEKGYLRGKNEKIILKKNSNKNTDGMPGLTSSAGKERESSKSHWLDGIR